MNERLLRLKEVMHRTGLARSTIYLWMTDGRFPVSFVVDRSTVAVWIESEVQEWIDKAVARGKTSRNEARWYKGRFVEKSRDENPETRERHNP